MDAFVSMLLMVGLMGAVVVVFRLFIRPPRAVSSKDPPGVRTIVTFAGDDPELLRDDRDDEPYVGVRLFEMLCDGLEAGGIGIEERGTIQNAQRASCRVDDETYSLVLEWIDEQWVVSVEWVAETAAEKRHLDLTQRVFAPPDSPALRQLLIALDRWLADQETLTDVAWHGKERWMAEDTSAAGTGPLD